MKRKSLTQTLVDSAKELGFEKATVDQLEALNIPKVKNLTAKDIRKLRERMNASQGVFARYLNVNTSTVQKWEQGAVRPQNAALKLLNLINEFGVEILLGKPAAGI
jgi:putative transcriptional regulator